MKKNKIYRFRIFSVKKKYSFLFGGGLLFSGYDFNTGRLKSLYVPLHKVFAVEDIEYTNCCFFEVNKFGFISRVSVPVRFLAKSNKSLIDILGGIS